MKKFLKRVLKSLITLLSIFAFAIVASIASYFLQVNGMEKHYADLVSMASILFIVLLITTE
jgi:drug/metabolite transporter (DMT)-like permease